MKLKDITSISETYYVVGRWFTIFMYAVSLATLPFALSRWESIISFVMCAGLAFVGCAAQYKDKIDAPVHYGAAAISAICAIIFTWHVCPWCMAFLLGCLYALYDRKRWVLWCEIAVILMAYSAIIIG